MKTLIVSAIALVALLQGPSASADEKPPTGNDTGCCFSFDDSPVTLVFCMTENACRL